MQFDLDRDIDGAALDVQTASSVAARQLPVEMTIPPSFRKVNPGDFPILLHRLHSPTVPLSDIDEYGEIMLAQQISLISGVAQVHVYGAQKFAVSVQVDPWPLAARNISLEDVRSASPTPTPTRRSARSTGPSRACTLRPPPPMTQSRGIPQGGRGLPQRRSGPARGDRARHRQRRRTTRSRAGSTTTVRSCSPIQRQPDANTVAVVDAIRSRAAAMSGPACHPRSACRLLNDRSVSIRNSVADVQYTLTIAICLVVLVIFMFLRSVTATHHSGPGAAGLADRHVRRRCTVRLLDRQSCRCWP